MSRSTEGYPDRSIVLVLVVVLVLEQSAVRDEW